MTTYITATTSREEAISFIKSHVDKLTDEEISCLMTVFMNRQMLDFKIDEPHESEKINLEGHDLDKLFK